MGAADVEDALVRQRESCASLGSPLYAALLAGIVEDHRGGGITAEILDGVTVQPVDDALALRFLAAGHLLALQGHAPDLARHFPSCGGRGLFDGDVITGDFLATVQAHRSAFTTGVRRNVQTNEVGRAAVLACGFALVSRRWRLPLDLLELGGSAGLLSRWDAYGYDTGGSRLGDRTSTVQFGPSWWSGSPPLLDLEPLDPDIQGHSALVRRRRACDIAPLDVATDEGRQVMLSYVWPDQTERIDRLRAALDIARRVPVEVERADAGEWLDRQLASGPEPGAATVVFHSIVWQYLPTTTKDRVRAVLRRAGSDATPEQPLCWLRMEPFDATVADLRLTTWPGGDDVVLATVGYHGADVRWSPAAAAR